VCVKFKKKFGKKHKMLRSVIFAVAVATSVRAYVVEGELAPDGVLTQAAATAGDAKKRQPSGPVSECGDVAFGPTGPVVTCNDDRKFWGFAPHPEQCATRVCKAPAQYSATAFSSTANSQEWSIAKPFVIDRSEHAQQVGANGHVLSDDDKRVHVYENVSAGHAFFFVPFTSAISTAEHDVMTLTFEQLSSSGDGSWQEIGVAVNEPVDGVDRGLLAVGGGPPCAHVENRTIFHVNQVEGATYRWRVSVVDRSRLARGADYFVLKLAVGLGDLVCSLCPTLERYGYSRGLQGSVGVLTLDSRWNQVLAPLDLQQLWAAGEAGLSA
jgi:hypothetical protein